MSESFPEQVNRLAAMIHDDGDTWDLTQNDQAAIRAVLAALTNRDERIKMLEAELTAKDEQAPWHWQKRTQDAEAALDKSETENARLREALVMLEMALDNYFSYSPSRRDDKAIGPISTARRLLNAVIK